MLYCCVVVLYCCVVLLCCIVVLCSYCSSRTCYVCVVYFEDYAYTCFMYKPHCSVSTSIHAKGQSQYFKIIPFVFFFFFLFVFAMKLGMHHFPLVRLVV